MGSVASKEANQIITSNFGFVTLVDSFMLGSRKKSRVTSAFAPMSLKPSMSKVSIITGPLGYMVQVALTLSAVMLESITGRTVEFDLTLA